MYQNLRHILSVAVFHGLSRRSADLLTRRQKKDTLSPHALARVRVISMLRFGLLEQSEKIVSRSSRCTACDRTLFCPFAKINNGLEARDDAIKINQEFHFGLHHTLCPPSQRKHTHEAGHTHGHDPPRHGRIGLRHPTKLRKL